VSADEAVVVAVVVDGGAPMIPSPPDQDGTPLYDLNCFAT
jgi:hypothetical protein